MTEYKLLTPIVFGEDVIESIQLEEPTVEQLRKHNVDLSREGLELCEGQYRLVSACASNVTEAHVTRMKMKDLVRCSGECIRFFMNCRSQEHPS
jgi:hypothetical protein